MYNVLDSAMNRGLDTAMGYRRMDTLDTAMKYRHMEETIPNSSMLREVKEQYADMANGGDGGELGYTPSNYDGPPVGDFGPTCRAYNYPDHPDSFFQEVCALLNWEW